jgi:hypothetical protein
MARHSALLLMTGYTWECSAFSIHTQCKHVCLCPFVKRGSIHMKFSMTGQERGHLLIQVTGWFDSTSNYYYIFPIFRIFLSEHNGNPAIGKNYLFELNM